MAPPGLEILFHATQNSISLPQDAISIVLHWVLVSDGYKCVGLGEENAQEEETEMLPSGWSENKDLYVLRYKKNSKYFLLKIIRIENDLLINFMDVKEEKVVNFNANISEYTTEDLSSFKSALKNTDNLCKLFKEEILNGLQCNTSANIAAASSARESSRSQENPSRSYEDPLRVPPRHPQRQPPPDWLEGADPFSIGRADLDPLAGGGGMMFDPFRAGRPRMGPDPSAGLPSRLPRGAIPPGARFDPFGPPGTRPGPDPDHEQPPGYDDMFM